MITSIQNPQIQQIRELIRDSKIRKTQQKCVVEGVRLLEESLLTGNQPDLVIFSDKLSQRGKELLVQCEQLGSTQLEVTDDLLQRISDTQQSQGIIAILPIPSHINTKKLDFILIMDNIRDPGNAGTMLRTAAAAGVQAVWLSPGCVDVFSPKVLRAGMGAHFHIDIQSLNWDEIRRASELAGLNLYLADSNGGMPHHTVDLTRPTGLVICNEAEGPSDEARTCVHQSIQIRMPGKFESLNASVAAAILLFEVVRQRTN